MNVRGNAYPHWGLKQRCGRWGWCRGPSVRGNAYPHWGLKHTEEPGNYAVYGSR